MCFVFVSLERGGVGGGSDTAAELVSTTTCGPPAPPPCTYIHSHAHPPFLPVQHTLPRKSRLSIFHLWTTSYADGTPSLRFGLTDPANNVIWTVVWDVSAFFACTQRQSARASEWADSQVLMLLWISGKSIASARLVSHGYGVCVCACVSVKVEEECREGDDGIRSSALCPAYSDFRWTLQSGGTYSTTLSTWRPTQWVGDVSRHKKCIKRGFPVVRESNT